jgi:GTP-binding protein
MISSALNVDYIGSFTEVSKCPVYTIPEYCFIGRSNVGKSSIINYLTNKDDLARTSRKPGKTQTINIFKVMENPEWVIADLPGYGYAQVSKSTRGNWSNMIDNYVLNRENLVNAFLLLDIRHPQMENDRDFMRFLGQHHVPFSILFTKSDKLKPAELETALADYKAAILEEWEELPPFFVTSSTAELGREEILAYIRQMNDTFTR